MMKEFILILLAIALIFFGFAAFNESAASKARARGEARAMVIQAQGQARLDSAQAAAITAASMFPFAALITMVFVALLIVVFGSVWVFAIVKTSAPPAPPGPYIIETKTVLLLPEGATRRQVYQALSAGRSEVKLAEYRGRG